MPTIDRNKKINTRPGYTNGNRKERMKIYNSQRWRSLREWKMKCSPLCEECEKEGRLKPVDDVHHIISFMSTDDPIRRKQLAYSFDNLMSLCDECHQKKHNKPNYPAL